MDDLTQYPGRGGADRSLIVNQESTDDTVRRQIEKLRGVLDISCQMAGMSELQPLLEMIIRSAREVLECELASVFLHEPKTDELCSRVFTIRPPAVTGAPVVRFPADKGLAGEAFRTGSIINVPDAYEDSRFNPEIDKKTGYTTQSVLSCPLQGWDNSPVGVLQAINKRGRPFDHWDEELARTFSAQAGVAVQRQLLLDEYAGKKRLERELDIARNIQQALLPKSAPCPPGFDLAGWNQPADQTGGDFYDFEELGGDAVAITVADATGHGLGPALVAAQCRALLRASLSQTQALERLVPSVNRLLCEDLPDDIFVTVFLGLLVPGTSRVRFLSAGHGPILIFRAATGEIREVEAQGCPLGIGPTSTYLDPVDVDLERGDLLIVLTDGFNEWPRADKELFGMERVCECIRRDHALAPAEIIRNLHHDVLAFAAGAPQVDDLTAVVVKKI